MGGISDKKYKYRLELPPSYSLNKLDLCTYELSNVRYIINTLLHTVWSNLLSCNTKFALLTRGTYLPPALADTYSEHDLRRPNKVHLLTELGTNQEYVPNEVLTKQATPYNRPVL